MNLVEKIDRALGLKVIFEAEQGQIIPRETWMTADDDTLAKLATTNSRNDFWRAVRKLGKEADDDYILAMGQEEDKTQLRAIRREARRFANERSISAPRKTKLARTDLGKTRDIIGMSPEELAAAEKTRGERPKKQYPSDTVYNVVSPDGKVIATFPSEDEATQEIAGDPEKYPGDPNEYKIEPVENQRSLSKLIDIKLPLQQGWNEDEVVSAMMPYIRSLAWKFHSDKAPYEDLIQHGAIGVLNALRTDKGEAPFGHHAWRHIKGEVRHAALTGGVVKGSTQAGGGAFGQRGPIVGYDIIYKTQDGKIESKHFPSEIKGYEDYFSKTGRMPPRTNDAGFKKAVEFSKQMQKELGAANVTPPQERRTRITSTDMPTRTKEGEGMTLGATVKGTKMRNPVYIAQTREMIKKLKAQANLTPQQEKVLDLTFGLDDPEAGVAAAPKVGEPESGEEGEPRKPGEQAGLPAPPLTAAAQRKKIPGRDVEYVREPSDVAKMLKISPEKARQHREKALGKIRASTIDTSRQLAASVADYAKKQGYQVESLDKIDNKIIKEKLAELNQLILVEEMCRQLIIQMIISGDINGTIQAA